MKEKNIEKKVPIRRNVKFFGAEDRDLEESYALEYLEQDANQTIVLYQVDLEKTKVNDIYHEAAKDAIRYSTPIEIPVVYEIEDAELKAYNNKYQKGMYVKTGKLRFTVLLKTLREYNCDIKRGDYVRVDIDSSHCEYFTVTDDGRVGATANKMSLYGKEPLGRTCTCAPVDMGEFEG